MQVEILPQHRWLQKLVGEWTFEHEATMGPGQEPIKVRGTETVRPLGDAWVLCYGDSEMPGTGVHKTVMTLGYDPAKQRFVGSFIGNMMTFFWVYDGELDASGKALVLSADGPSFTGTGMTKYQDKIEFLSDDHRTLTATTPGPDGSWQTFMTAHYRRK
jgi:hypothetical protein